MKKTLVFFLWNFFTFSQEGIGINGAEQNLYDLDNCPVQELHPESYQKILEKEKMTIIVFYAPVCLRELNI
jgi:hypothetical protein